MEISGPTHVLIEALYSIEKVSWAHMLEYDALDHHRVSRCKKDLLVMMVSYQDECFDQHEWELETG